MRRPKPSIPGLSAQRSCSRSYACARLYAIGTQLAVLLSFGQPVLAQQVPVEQAISVGAYHARGDYGENLDTKINYLPISYEYNRERWGLQFMVPHLQVTGFGNVLVNVGGITQAVAGDRVTREQGPGDAVVTALYHLDPIAGVFLDLRIDLKLPTADEKRALGTGEMDISAQVDASANIGEAAIFASAGYNLRGKTGLYPGLKNSFFTQLGIAKPIDEVFSIGAFYDYRQSASRYTPESHELSPYFSWQFSEAWSFTGLAVFGFTDASAERAIMGQLRYRW